jgi:hypothetical protein
MDRIRSTFRCTISQPCLTRSGRPFSKPELTRYIPPSRPVRSPLIPCEIDPTRRPIEVSCDWSSRSGVMSVDISMIESTSPAALRTGAVVQRT